MRVTADTYHLRTAATTLPVSIADAKRHLRITHSNHDDLVEDLIWGATKAFEKKANVCLSAQTWKAFLPKLDSEIVLWKSPITLIQSIRYFDSDNTLATLSTSDYYSNVNTGSMTDSSPRPVVIFVDSIPATYIRDDAVQINFTAGYSSIDYDVKQALLSWVYRKYENPNDPVTEKVSFFDTVVQDLRSYGL